MHLLALMFYLTMLSHLASGLFGTWVTPDRSVVSIYPCAQNQACLRLVQIASRTAPQTDKNNPDAAQRQRALCGLEMGKGFKVVNPTRAEGGTLYDPMSGKTYNGTMVAEGDQLKLRGYVGVPLFGRTETWQRTQEVPKSCSGNSP